MNVLRAFKEYIARPVFMQKKGNSYWHSARSICYMQPSPITEMTSHTLSCVSHALRHMSHDDLKAETFDESKLDQVPYQMNYNCYLSVDFIPSFCFLDLSSSPSSQLATAFTTTKLGSKRSNLFDSLRVPYDRSRRRYQEAHCCRC
jgi:hypothetical protein